ncbi:zinc finger protein 462-like [Xiphias gladius]|uniref:zinc finger protein 462-like n=1 Tax=Xiphias gladius TaxID=8245 RepID=UPI001A985471|nr:zinc finger protein 462-like [Xiphias gladius]XP_040010707.1 zinc finger protein 462-like [Xiphias gladius]XP_040010708.1 zinc finger protein 462-like [Xiphias gladius]
MKQSQAAGAESRIKSVHCSHCTLLFESKVYLFKHLNEVHGLDVDTALRAAGLQNPEADKVNSDDKSNSSGNNLSCRRCDFTACGREGLNEHEKQCNRKSEKQNGLRNLIISADRETKITVIPANQRKEGAVMSTSKTTCSLNSSKDLKTHKRPVQIQTITKYFPGPSGSNGEPSVKLAESPVLLDHTKGTLILQESPSSSSPNSSGVFKVTAKSMIDLSKTVSDQFMLNDRPLNTDLRRHPKPAEKSKDMAPNSVGKRTSCESPERCPAKKAKTDKEEAKLPEKAKVSKQQSSSSTEFSFDIREDEEDKKVPLFNGDRESPEVYFCKHCDYSDVGVRSVSAHYQKDHPYIRCNAVYIRDPSDRSATFRCLDCPVEFLSIADLKRHYAENHPKAPKVFAHSRELSLVFKCFVCPFTTNELKALKEHYKEKHPKHKVDNGLLDCRYSATRCQEGSSQLSACEKTHSPERSEGISPKIANTQYEEVKNASSPQHLTSKGADAVLYQCNNCNFTHKSAVVMHAHYQKGHPDDAVTIEKIKQSAHVAPQTTSQRTPEKSQQEISLSVMNLKHAPDASKTRSESPKTEKVKSAEDRGQTKMSPTKCDREVFAGMDSLYSSLPSKMFYCQFCSYSSINIRSVVGHQNAKHAAHRLTGTEQILSYTAEVQKKKLQSDAEASASTACSDSQTSKRVKVCSEKELQHEEDDVADASMTALNPYACAEKLFYCQKCNFGNPTVKGVLNHQAIIHRHINSNRECIIKHTALIRDEIEKSKSHTKELSFSTRLPLPLLNEDDENMFFCHFCNYRQNTLNHVIKHYFKRHRGFEIKADQIHLYTSMVLKQTQKLHLKATANQEVNCGKKGNKKTKTKTLAKCLSFSASPSVRATQTQRTLQCHRCTYSSQYVYHLRRHMWKTHRANRSVSDVLRVCFKQGMLQSGYHCDLCVFSHEDAAAVHSHYQDNHPGRRVTLEYVSTQLYVGPDATPPQRKKPQIRHTDGISDGDGTDATVLSQRFGQNETKTYSCRACSFKGSSMSSITRHYRAVHPWSVKEDGSVLNVITNKKSSANSQVEDPNEIPGLFDAYQVPLEFGMSPGSPREATASPTMIQCHYCPARFQTQRGLSTHCGMKHQEAVTGSLYEQCEQHEQHEQQERHEQQVQIQTRVHVFKCPYCTYINTNYQGILTHCQKKHPALVSRADSLHMDESHLHSWDDGLKRKGCDSLKLSGYMCKTCPQVYATLEKMNKHCENDHNETVANTVPNTLKPAPKPSAMSKTQQFNTHSTLGSVSKASFLRKKIYAVIRCQHCSYSCSTKIALARHLRVHYRNASVSKIKDCVYKCVLCSRSYFRKKRLGNHYTKKHGKNAFLKYYAPLYKQVPEKTVLTSPDCPTTQQPANTSEACESSATTEENKILVYKCPTCPYVNASYHGTLTHCQMKHPALIARADELKTDEILVTNIVRCTMGKGSKERGYMCKKCPQIYASWMKLKVHSERYHSQAAPAASDHSAETETETEKQPYPGSQGSVISTVNPTEIDHSQQQSLPETCQVSVQNKVSLYKCHMCTYSGVCRRYLHCHYKKTHKLDAFSTYKLLEKYNKRKRNKARCLLEATSAESAHVRCKKCPNLTFESSQLLIAHYCIFHSSDCKSDFTVLSRESKKSTGVYRCDHCGKQLNGIRKLCRHLDHHRARMKERTPAAKTKASFVFTTTPEATSIEICTQDELPILETVEELTQWNVTPVETFTLPTSPQSLPSKHTDPEQPELESREYKHTCKQCGRTFMSLKGLRSHERSHAALAAIKKLNNLPISALRHNINKYVLYKSGTLRPFLCSFCSYRTTVLGLWRSHFMKQHQNVIMDPAETGRQDEENTQRANKEHPNLSEEKNYLPAPDEEPEMIGKSLYLEPPDVQRQLNHYSLMAQTGISSKVNLQETEFPEHSLLHCEFCNFNTGHLSSVRRHYLNRHGKKILRCKDCNFFTGLRKTLEMHVGTGHSTCQSEPTHQKDLRCPFCLYQTKNKNNMIDHIVLHREERVVPIEVRRPKLSRYLQGIVFRCHKCTFTSGSAENLRLHMMRHDDIKPFKCRLCYFDCTLLSDLEAHLSDKHQVVRNHELVGQVSLDQLQARLCRMPEEDEEPLSNLEHNNNENEDVEIKEFFTDCNEVLRKTQAENPAESNSRKTVTLQMNEACLKHEQDPQEPAGIVFLPDTARGKRIEDIVEQNVGKGSNAAIQSEECSGPERERQTIGIQAQPKVRGSEGSSIMFTQQKKEAAEGSSSTYGNIAEKTKAHKLNIKVLQHRTLSIDARVENEILRRIVALDEDGSIRKIHKKADRDRTVKIEQNIETDCVDKTLGQLPDEEGSIILAHNSKLKVETNFLPNRAQLKISHKDSSGVSFTNCKEEQMCNQKNSEGVTDPYGEMPVLENEYLKEVVQPLGDCKEEEDHLEQKQDGEDEVITEGNENRCQDQEHEDGHRIEEADNPRVHKSALTAKGGAAEVLCPSVTEKPMFTCGFCGRNLTNSTELKRHIMRHGL